MPKETMSYSVLTAAGTEKYLFPNNRPIDYPDGEVVEWYGYRRHNIEIDGFKGFIVEPPHPAPGLPWSWCLQWAESFVPRTPALQLLERGFHHVHLDVFSTYLNDTGVKALEKFYDMLQAMHFNKKEALIGMSYGGLFSLRWAAEHPETVGAMYLDAPVCSLAFADEQDNDRTPPELLPFFQTEKAKHLIAYQAADGAALKNHPKNPLNNYAAIAENKIPILAIRSGQDQSVLPEFNIDRLEKLLLEAGGNIQVIRRDLWGHHPHGLDDPTPLTGFILQNYPDFTV